MYKQSGKNYNKIPEEGKRGTKLCNRGENCYFNKQGKCWYYHPKQKSSSKYQNKIIQIKKNINNRRDRSQTQSSQLYKTPLIQSASHRQRKIYSGYQKQRQSISRYTQQMYQEKIQKQKQNQRFQQPIYKRMERNTCDFQDNSQTDFYKEQQIKLFKMYQSQKRQKDKIKQQQEQKRKRKLQRIEQQKNIDRQIQIQLQLQKNNRLRLQRQRIQAERQRQDAIRQAEMLRVQRQRAERRQAEQIRVQRQRSALRQRQLVLNRSQLQRQRVNCPITSTLNGNNQWFFMRNKHLKIERNLPQRFKQCSICFQQLNPSNNNLENQSKKKSLGLRFLKCVTTTFCKKQEEPLPEQYLTELYCKHSFHTQCIEQWFKKNERMPTCPNCRVDFRTSQHYSKWDVNYKRRIN